MTTRAWEELRTSGLLWLINRVVFHPRGWALCLVRKDGEIVGWRLRGNGHEVWRFEDGEDDSFARAPGHPRRPSRRRRPVMTDGCPARIGFRVPAADGQRFAPHAFAASIGREVRVNILDRTVSGTVVDAQVCDDGASVWLVVDVPEPD